MTYIKLPSKIMLCDVHPAASVYRVDILFVFPDTSACFGNTIGFRLPQQATYKPKRMFKFFVRGTRVFNKVLSNFYFRAPIEQLHIRYFFRNSRPFQGTKRKRLERSDFVEQECRCPGSSIPETSSIQRQQAASSPGRTPCLVLPGINPTKFQRRCTHASRLPKAAVYWSLLHGRRARSLLGAHLY